MWAVYLGRLEDTFETLVTDQSSLLSYIVQFVVVLYCRDSEATIGVNNFESLRESIYAEVATLISRNEGHPHFLIELFRQLQELDSDYLRQRVLYAIQDLIFNRLTEEQVRDFKVIIYRTLC